MIHETLHQIDTEYSADSVEFCPVEGYGNLVVVGTYQVLEGVEGEPTKRKGRLLLYNVNEEYNISEVQREETGAILDLKWSTKKLNGEVLLGSTTATGNLDIYKIRTDVKSTYLKFQDLKLENLLSINNCKSNVLNLSLDWSNKVFANAGHNLVISQSDGSIQYLSLQNDLTVKKSWEAHGYEAWISAFDYYNPETVYTGGDDCLFKSWDLRTDLSRPTVTSKKHEAGVCTITSHHLQEYILATGSYDENIRIWDKRSFKNPLSTTNTSGGVWRIKFHPKTPNLMISACMYKGFQVFNSSGDFSSLEKIVDYSNHESIAYGVDWSYCSTNDHYLLGTCSFYDHLFNIWKLM